MNNSVNNNPSPREVFSLIEIIEGNKKILKKESEFLQAIGVARLIIYSGQKAIRAFKKRKYIQFDALVGENACQLRAAKIADLSQKYEKKETFRKEIEEAFAQLKEKEKKAHALIREEKFEASVKKKEKKSFPTLINFCREKEIDIPLSENIKFIIESYLLTKSKSTQIISVKEGEIREGSSSDRTEPELIQRFCERRQINFPRRNNNKPSVIVDKIIKEIQKDLSFASVKYLRKKAHKAFQIQASDSTRFAKEVAEKWCLEDEQKRLTAPAFYSLNTVFTQMLRKGHPLLIKAARYTEEGWRVNRFVDFIHLYYQPSEGDFIYIPDPNPEAGVDQTVCVLEGISVSDAHAEESKEAFSKKLQAVGILHLIRAFGANHTQYPGKKNQAASPPEDAERARLAQEAETIGCSRKNKTLFLAEHMYCDTYLQAIKREAPL